MCRLQEGEGERRARPHPCSVYVNFTKIKILECIGMRLCPRGRGKFKKITSVNSVACGCNTI